MKLENCTFTGLRRFNGSHMPTVTTPMRKRRLPSTRFLYKANSDWFWLFIANSYYSNGIEWRCDGDPDCSDMSDEVGCNSDGQGQQQSGSGGERECSTDEFQCTSGHCVKGTYRCDGEIHCSDVSDELNCDSSSMPSCLEGDFRCPDGQCIAQAWRQVPFETFFKF